MEIMGFELKDISTDPCKKGDMKYSVYLHVCTFIYAYIYKHVYYTCMHVYSHQDPCSLKWQSSKSIRKIFRKKKDKKSLELATVLDGPTLETQNNP